MGKVTTLSTGAAGGDIRAAFAAHLDEAGLTVAQSAREIGRRESTILRWLNRKYSGDNDAVEALVARWLETQAVIARMRDRNYLLVVDEAHFLRVGLCLDLTTQPVADVEQIAAGPLGRKPDKAELRILTAAARGPGGLHALRRLLGRAFMVARAEGRDRIAPADIAMAADEGVAADEGGAAEAVA